MKSLSSLFLHAAKMGIPPQVFWQLLLLGLTVQPSEEVEALCSGTTCYTLNFGRFGWMEAQQKCKDNGGNLMTLKSQEEALLVPQLLTKIPKGEAGTVSEVRLWIGLHRKKGKCYEKHRPLRGFRWVTGGEDTQYSNWGQEPRETCLSNMCVTLQGTPFSSQELSWVDSLCGNANAGLSGFLCKFSFQGMCRPLILAGPGMVSYSTPFGVATDFLVTVPFGSTAEVACEPQGEEIPNIFLVCKPQPNSNVSEWSSPGPFCASLTYGCSYNNGGCEHECLNQGKGLFQCACHSGYQLGRDHLSCVPVDYCSSNPCQGQCKPYPGGFQCLCASGYILADDERSCIDVNECGAPQSPCEQICVNTKGSFTCRCNLGYMPAESGHQACQDIDECARNTPCDQICVNTHGSFHCSCQPGYQLEGINSSSCLDIDECQEELCEHMCINQVGSYLCSCRDGWILAPNGISCLLDPTSSTSLLSTQGGEWIPTDIHPASELPALLTDPSPQAELGVFASQDSTLQPAVVSSALEDKPHIRDERIDKNSHGSKQFLYLILGGVGVLFLVSFALAWVIYRKIKAKEVKKNSKNVTDNYSWVPDQGESRAAGSKEGL
ncbi:complement component C1q receptor [Pantherophis guttatus]|uniref:Complement component C1q receptor n=1 Tax=Pantherophis guttatus TaxID=94885 RepID=A0A6P9B9W9_PANGU|nr:complement component C1q receptor [Pantherophis guttatus]